MACVDNSGVSTLKFLSDECMMLLWKNAASQEREKKVLMGERSQCKRTRDGKIEAKYSTIW